MKKFIYILLFALVSAVSFSACTEEEDVTPSNELENGGGNSSGDKGGNS